MGPSSCRTSEYPGASSTVIVPTSPSRCRRSTTFASANPMTPSSADSVTGDSLSRARSDDSPKPEPPPPYAPAGSRAECRSSPSGAGAGRTHNFRSFARQPLRSGCWRPMVPVRVRFVGANDVELRLPLREVARRESCAHARRRQAVPRRHRSHCDQWRRLTPDGTTPVQARFTVKPRRTRRRCRPTPETLTAPAISPVSLPRPR